ncbi:hypothetical protein F4778DRAFT_712307 [Xylariomycetidae sp. FL2044]|nr:hypothetical protein F4778DRAFT_712307 [Xylariomycetidae sp. FL2044]
MALPVSSPYCDPIHGDEDRTSSPRVPTPLPPLTEDSASTVGDSLSDVSEFVPPPDKNEFGWDNFRVLDQNTKAVYEAWDITSLRPTLETSSSTIRILGLNVRTCYTVRKRAFRFIRPVPYYSQHELEQMILAEQTAFDASRSKFARLTRKSSYAEDLAARVFELPCHIVHQVGNILEDRFTASNIKNPFARREWKVVALKRTENVMCDAPPPKTKRRMFLRRELVREEHPVQKWLLIIRGQETMTSDEGFKASDLRSNPWLKVDEKVARDSEDLNKEMDGWGN